MPFQNNDTSLVRIWGCDDRPVGAGFIISPCHIMTCAHVIARALPKVSGDSPQKPLEVICIDFPLLSYDHKIPAKVFKWEPVCQNPTPGKIEDIAVLEMSLPDELRNEIIPFKFPKIDQGMDYFINRSVRILGFPIDQGIWSYGIIFGKTGYGWMQIEKKQDSPSVTEGFSGAAVLDIRDNHLLGMINAKMEKDEHISFAVPVTTLSRAYLGPVVHKRKRLDKRGFSHKMCNRGEQVEAFCRFFSQQYENYPQRPQFYLCHGEREDCPGSLIERFEKINIPSYFGESLPKEISLNHVRASFSFSKDHMDLRRELPQKLLADLEKREPNYVRGKGDFEAFFQSTALQKCQIAIISHTFDSSQWKSDYLEEIKAYMKGFQENFTAFHQQGMGLPQFLLFFCLVTEEKGAMSWLAPIKQRRKRKIRKELEAICASFSETCFLFDEFPFIEPCHVIDWYDWLYNVFDLEVDESERIKFIKDLFKSKQQHKMYFIEGKLKKICSLYDDKYREKKRSGFL